MTNSNQSIIVIAEAGVNHNGSLKLALEMIDKAKDAGADFIKFQTFSANALVTKDAKQAKYQLKNSKKSESQLSMISSLELSHADHKKIFSYCEKKEIKCISSPFDVKSAKFLKSLGMTIFKVPSGEITNRQLLEYISLNSEEVILSTGMSTLEDITLAIEVLNQHSLKNLTILQCTTNYPVAFEEVNLKAMLSMKEKFNVNVGFSDHTLGTEIALAASALGASIIEKHFTLSRDMSGPDHNASLEPDELKDMISGIRNIEKALGSGVKEPMPCEIENMSIARKSLVASRAIAKGDEFTYSNITSKRPGTGISPMKIHTLIGKKSSRDYSPDDLIEK